MSKSPNVKFFAYTRVWQVEKIEPYLRALAALENMRLWYSADRDTGVPPNVPEGVRIAYTQTSDKESVAGDLVFQIRGCASWSCRWRYRLRTGTPLKGRPRA